MEFERATPPALRWVVAFLAVCAAMGLWLGFKDQIRRNPPAWYSGAPDPTTPGVQPGDATVTAWQLAALRSAGMAGIVIPSPTLDGVVRFLDRVQVRRGEAYGYQSPQARPCTSAIGLLCRLYTAWPDEATIDRGLTALAKGGPAPDAIYLNFYLAQALLQGNHRARPAWNRRNRDQLVALQAAVGHEAGSWFLADADTAPGGRLAHTALAVLTLEVYYRLLPIYGQAAVGGF